MACLRGGIRHDAGLLASQELLAAGMAGSADLQVLLRRLGGLGHRYQRATIVALPDHLVMRDQTMLDIDGALKAAGQPQYALATTRTR